MKFITRFMLLMVLPLAALAVPGFINYQGRLLDNNGIPITQSNVAMVVSIWTASTAGTKLYQENQTVNVNDGVYAFQIGNGTGGSPAWNPSSLFNTSSPRFVELTVQGQTLTPRIQLLSAPFTLQSGNSDNLGGNGPAYYGTASMDSILQGQIDNLNLRLGEICVLNNGFWDGTKCVQGLPVIDNGVDEFVPVDQSGLHKVQWGEEVEGECPELHFHPYSGQTGAPPVKNCKGNIVEDKDSRGCGLGKVSQVRYIPIDQCEVPPDGKVGGK